MSGIKVLALRPLRDSSTLAGILLGVGCWVLVEIIQFSLFQCFSRIGTSPNVWYWGVAAFFAACLVFRFILARGIPFLVTLLFLVVLKSLFATFLWPQPPQEQPASAAPFALEVVVKMFALSLLYCRRDRVA